MINRVQNQNKVYNFANNQSRTIQYSKNQQMNQTQIPPTNLIKKILLQIQILIGEKI